MAQIYPWSTCKGVSTNENNMATNVERRVNEHMTFLIVDV